MVHEIRRGTSLMTTDIREGKGGYMWYREVDRLLTDIRRYQSQLSQRGNRIENQKSMDATRSDGRDTRFEVDRRSGPDG